MKKILIVVKDNLETKLLCNSIILNKFLKNKKIFLITQTNEKYYRQEILKVRNDVNLVKFHIKRNKITLFLYKVSFFIEHLASINKSISSYQKVLFLLKLKSENILDKKYYKKNFAKLKFFHQIAKMLNFDYLSIFRKKSNLYDFDYILFSRPDDIDNLDIYNTYSSRKTKVVTLIRNFDTPCLKRLFVIPSDITLYYDEHIKKLVQNNLSSQKYAKLKKMPYYLDNYDVESLYKYNSEEYVIYATSQKEFFSNNISEEELINSILEILSEKNIKLIIRVHPNHKNEYMSLKLKGNFSIQNELYSIFKTNENKEIEMLTQRDIINYISFLKNAKCLLTNGSTIAYDAYNLRINTYFINLDDNWMLYEREHLQELISMGIKKLRTMSQLEFELKRIIYETN
ncbi:hypothetical protein AAHK07_01765 [Aliarcobacter cryaerophilus]|uniref:hypothetical protein n=1 Tax=Aliarcobacter cryaerophilus TaxID=28198 RepID=UPI00316F26A5